MTQTSAVIAWKTDEGSDTQVEFGTATSYDNRTPLDPAMQTSHSRTLTGLKAGTLYHYRVLSSDATGNRAVSADYTFTTSQAPDTTPPVIGSVYPAAAADSATVSWTTDEPSDSQVEYRTGVSYGQSSPLQAANSTAHSVTLAGLSPKTAYHYRVRSRDAADNVAVSGDYTFTTLVFSRNFITNLLRALRRGLYRRY